MITAWHWTTETLRDGRPLPAVGEWLVHDGPVVICDSGLHASKDIIDALSHAPGMVCHRVTCDDIVDEHGSKLVCRRRRIDATYRPRIEVIVAWACECACEAARACGLSGLEWDRLAEVARGLLDGGATVGRARSEAMAAAEAAPGEAPGEAAWDAREAAAEAAMAAEAAGAWSARAAWEAGAAGAARERLSARLVELVTGEQP